MAIVNTDRLNEFYEDGVLPLKQSLVLHNTAITELQSAVQTEQDNIDDLEDAVELLQNTGTGGGSINAYIRTGQTALSSTWLSATGADGQSITPAEGVIYIVVTSGDYYNQMYRYNSTSLQYELVSAGASGGTPSVGGGIINVYIRTGATEFGNSWLSTTSASGEALVPRSDVLYVILSSGDNYGRVYRWDVAQTKYEPIKGVGGGGGSDDEDIDVDEAIAETLEELNTQNTGDSSGSSDTTGNQTGDNTENTGTENSGNNESEESNSGESSENSEEPTDSNGE